MRRRDFMTLVGGAATAWPLAARAQQAQRMRRIGVLIGFAETDPDVNSWFAAFRGALAKLGWTEGSNFQIELRWPSDDLDRMKAFAKELVDLRPDAILSVTTPVTNALVRETQTIPIVIVTVADPIASGFVTNVGRPGGNVTGFALYEPSMGGKWLELLKRIAPGVKRVALLFNPTTSVPIKFYMASIQAGASSFTLQASAAPVHAQDEIEGVIAALAGNPGAGLIAMPDLFNTINRDVIIAAAARYRIPAIYFVRSFADSGGLISYGPDFAEQYPRAAGYIDRILKGEKPGDLPIQMPIKVPLIINLRTANALGLDVPLGLLNAADEIIE
ncbi:ABC transporter substrate-binding protein [Bradyrhizobium sp. CCGUVB1N3]|uniref:ABC transporter substrate-binding protein n=1 Tax=Bradyrhizobium sp. CCGUVB1N3 TaxID=2949629 RepID=UPI0020B1D18B|nr:ABC transporter substrate-binding protein [Bradyrhizobium sp. CCGUVB1N3]MCP3475107.1 ABC transporter substrate-binding protein [Bradyrhizobium sp. CCGUVB1N3]